MNRTQLEHVIRAAAAIKGQNALIVIGSQAILGTVSGPAPFASARRFMTPTHAARTPAVKLERICA